MLSLYFHIPFCDKKCAYCNFFVYPNQQPDAYKAQVLAYEQAMLREIDYWHDLLWKQEIKTIYFGWWTPLQLWKQALMNVIDRVCEKFDVENLEEISFELNPNPFDEVYDFIRSINKKYKNFFRIRYSFWVQTLDEKLLQQTNRSYTFNQLVQFLRWLQDVKENNNTFNFDFIAFGKETGKDLWDIHKRSFYENFVFSWFADSFSIYTIELFPWSAWYKDQGLLLNDENIIQEFDYLTEVVQEAGYRRYEISNFELQWRGSLHNRVYWEMGSYIWLWISASSYLSPDLWKTVLENPLSKQFYNAEDLWMSFHGVRFTTTKSRKDYFAGNYIDPKSIIALDEKSYMQESFFLALRTGNWVKSLNQFGSILRKDYEDVISELQKQQLVNYEDDHLLLTNEGYKVYNSIVTELLKDI